MSTTPNTKAVLPGAIVQLTRAPEPWVEYRIRVLSEARLLPRRRELLTFNHLPYAFCGLYGSDTHLEAVERAKRIYSLHTVTLVQGDGVLFPDELRGLPYGEVLAALLRHSQRPGSLVEVRGLTICSTHDEADLLLAGQVTPDPASYTVETYRFGVPGRSLASHDVAVKTRHEISGTVFRALAQLGSDPVLLPTSSASGQFSEPENENGDALAGAPPLTSRPRDSRETRAVDTPDNSGCACVLQASRAREAVTSNGVTSDVRRLEEAEPDLCWGR